jgi:hypothetical protein
MTVLFSDQNFISSMEADSGNCLNIVRLEDASLADLINIAKEMFERTTLPEGSSLARHLICPALAREFMHGNGQTLSHMQAASGVVSRSVR